MLLENCGIFLVIFLACKSNAQLCRSKYEPYFSGACILQDSCHGALINSNECLGQLKCCIPENKTEYANPALMSIADLENVLSVKNSRIEYIAKVLAGPFSRPTCFQKAFYITQLVQDSDAFLNTEESGSDSELNAKYNGKMGNNETGDGAKYKGRGFIKLTGRSNYKQAGLDLGIELEKHPELAAFPSIASKISKWYWLNKTGENLNTFSDGTFYGFSRITNLVNGGLNGFKKRVDFLEDTIRKLECGELMKGSGENCTINGRQGLCKPICNVGLVGKKYCGCNGKTVANQCQGPANIRCCDETCSNSMDLTFVLDSSGSIGRLDYEKAKSFIGQFVDKLEIGPNKSQVAVVKYSSSVSIETYLNSTTSKKPLLSLISNITFVGGSTSTGEALYKCFSVYSPANGMRDSSTGVSRVIVVLTDGKSNTGRTPIPPAQSLKMQKISIISVGVGSDLNLIELKNISSNNRFYRATDYNQVALIYDELNQVSCLEPAVIPNNTLPIEVEKDSFKYFTYVIENLNATLGININVDVLFGDVKLFSSLTNENPNDYEVVDLDASGEKNANNGLKNDQNLLQLDPKANFSQVFIGVKGLMDYNQFSIEIKELETLPTIQNNSSLNLGPKLSLYLLFFFSFLFK